MGWLAAAGEDEKHFLERHAMLRVQIKKGLLFSLLSFSFNSYYFFSQYVFVFLSFKSKRVFYFLVFLSLSVHIISFPSVFLSFSISIHIISFPSLFLSFSLLIHIISCPSLSLSFSLSVHFISFTNLPFSLFLFLFHSFFFCLLSFFPNLFLLIFLFNYPKEPIFILTDSIFLSKSYLTMLSLYLKTWIFL
jgi:hypothetical protein